MSRVTINKQMIRIPSLNVYHIKKLTFIRRAFFLSSGKTKAGMALEGSLVLPIFLFYMMTILLGLEVVRFQSQVQEALYLAGNEKAFSEYQVKYEKGVEINIEQDIRKYLETQLVPYLCVRGKENGIRIQDLSDEKNGQIEYVVNYQIKPFIEWIPIGKVEINDRFVSHSWTGYCAEESSGSSNHSEVYVYVTRTGRKYHLSYDCSYLKIQVYKVTYEELPNLRNQSGGKYYACERCKPSSGGVAYITHDGYSYHSQTDCSSLKRTVYMIPLRETSEYRPCSKCAG